MADDYFKHLVRGKDGKLVEKPREKRKIKKKNPSSWEKFMWNREVRRISDKRKRIGEQAP